MQHKTSSNKTTRQQDNKTTRQQDTGNNKKKSKIKHSTLGNVRAWEAGLFATGPCTARDGELDLRAEPSGGELAGERAAGEPPLDAGELDAGELDAGEAESAEEGERGKPDAFFRGWRRSCRTRD
jgi:hypothetical protein